MSRVAARPLNQAAVKAADDEFYRNHPEMITEDGKRIPLSSTDPAHGKMREEWMDSYIANGGKIEEEEDTDDSGTPEPVEDCPLKKKKAKIKVKWSKESVEPDHNSANPPATPPTDTIPAEAKVEMIAETTEVPDGTKASMEVLHCKGSKVAEFQQLQVKGNKVVDTNTGKSPEMVFSAQHHPWDPWKDPFFYFKCKVEHEGLCGQTSQDFKKKPAECLRVIYWSVCLSDSTDLAGVQPECNNINGLLNGPAVSKSIAVDYKNVNTALNIYGSHLRNTYVLHQASHGNVLNRTTNASISTATSSKPPDDVANPAQWRSIVHFTPVPRFGDNEIKTGASVPSTPRYLYYASTCLTGWDTSFANAMIGRGTRHVIAFRVSIPDAAAPILARKIYTRWIKNYNMNPEKIPDCFFKYASDYYDNMRPVLYGPGGGQAKKDEGLSNAAIAAIAIAAVVGGVLVGVAIWAALK